MEPPRERLLSGDKERRRRLAGSVSDRSSPYGTSRPKIDKRVRTYFDNFGIYKTHLRAQISKLLGLNGSLEKGRVNKF